MGSNTSSITTSLPQRNSAVVYIMRPESAYVKLGKKVYDPPAVGEIGQPETKALGKGTLSTVTNARALKKLTGDDGYKWRKYGKKIIKGVPRHYFRCTHEGCNAKKQVQFIAGMGGEDHAVTTRVGGHNHLPFRTTRVSVTTQEQFVKLVAQHAGKPVKGPALSGSFQVTLASNLDPHEDGGRWKKYGHKVFSAELKQERSYNRCIVAGCPVKKQIEVDNGTYKVSYDGVHDHSGKVAVARKKPKVEKKKKKKKHKKHKKEHKKERKKERRAKKEERRRERETLEKDQELPPNKKARLLAVEIPPENPPPMQLLEAVVKMEVQEPQVPDLQKEVSPLVQPQVQANAEKQARLALEEAAVVVKQEPRRSSRRSTKRKHYAGQEDGGEEEGEEHEEEEEEEY